MSTLLYTGLGNVLPSIEKHFQKEAAFQLRHAGEPIAATDLQTADLFVVGPYEKAPVKVVQHITAADKYISIIVLAFPADFLKVKQSLQFAPFVGKNSLCISYTESLDIVQAFTNAAQRTRQRRSFSRINGMANAVSALSANKVRVENLGVFLEQAPIGAFLLDERENVIAINERAKKIFGVTAEKQYVLKDFFPTLSLQQLKLKLSAATAYDVKEVQAAGLFLELTLSEVANEDGKHVNILLVNDITEQKKKEAALKESEALFRFMAEAVPQKVWTADEKGELNFFNQHWTEYTGRSYDELKGWGWLQNIHPDDAARNREVWQRAIDTGNDFEFEQRILRSDGAYRWHLVRGTAKKGGDGKIQMWVGTNTDIHEQVAFAEELEARVKERTYELEKSNSELEQFVYVTSHDLQEPLRKIRLFSELLKESQKELDAASQKHLDKISATALRLSTLLKELLNFTQLSREEQFEKTDLNKIVTQAMVDLELVIHQKSAQVQTGHLPIITAIPVQMHQLFYNLINNALKFSKADAPPVVHITAQTAGAEEVAKHKNLLPDKAYCKIIVQDNGIGFDQNYAGQIFNIFQRLHNRNAYSGTGIGLALCKKVVTNHYGDIYARSTPGEGAAFHILLPVN